MKTQSVEFQNDEGLILSGRLEMPDDENPLAFAMFAHCFTCTKDYKSVTYISRQLAGRGIAVLRFDFAGLGESEGDFSETNFSTNVNDLVAAARFLEEDYEPPKVLIGHSLGGAAVLQAASRLPSTKAVVTIAAPCSPRHVEHLVEGRRQELEQKGKVVVSVSGRPFTIKKQFIDDLEELRMDESIRNLGAALLVFHSTADHVVSMDNADHIFQTARFPKSFVALDNAHHLLLDAGDADYVGKVIAAWSDRYIRRTGTGR